MAVQEDGLGEPQTGSTNTEGASGSAHHDECSVKEAILSSYGPPAILAAAIASPLSALVTIFSGPETASAVITLSIIAYLLASSLNLTVRLPLLSVAAATHLAALTTYYSNPLPLPLFIIERGAMGSSINIDIVQIVVAAEAAGFLQSLECKQPLPGEKDSKTPVEISEDGPQAGEQEA